MASPLGMFVAVRRLDWYRTVGEPKSWFERIFVDFGEPGSPNHMETLTLVDLVRRSNVTGLHRFNRAQLDLIKDFLPKFDYLFVTGAPPWEANMGNARSRTSHINITREFSRQFIEYLKENNINIPIHWFIAPEAHLNSLASDVGNWKKYISQYVGVMTDLSAEYGLNVPEFLWSPFFKEYPSLVWVREAIRDSLHDLLTSVPKLTWLHVQDGVGARSRKHSDGTITYELEAKCVIDYYNNILRPAAKGTNVKSNLINMEFFIFKDNPDDPAHPFIIPGDPIEQQQRQTKYLQANVPLGISFEIAYWYGSLYYQEVPRVIRMRTNIAKQLINQAGLVANVIGVEHSYVTDQSPKWPDFVERGGTVNLTTGELSTTVIVPGVLRVNARVAKRKIREVDLVPVISGSQTNTVVGEQSPDGGEEVERKSRVYLTMVHDQP